MAQKSNTPEWKIVATVLGIGFGLTETWLNSDTVAHSDPAGWVSPNVAIVILASLGALAALPLAERSWKDGQHGKSVGLCVLFLLVAGYSFDASLSRVSGGQDAVVATARNDNKTATLLDESYEAAKKTAEDECKSGRGTRCREAEAKRDKALAATLAAPAQRVEDSSTARETAVLPFLSAEKVRTYKPLLLPLAFQIGAWVSLALGLSPQGKPVPLPKTEGEPKAKKQRKPRKRRKTAVSQLQPSNNVVPFSTKPRQ